MSLPQGLCQAGHSLGGAIAEIDSLFFALNIPGVSIKTMTYGTPRVGNLEFAQLIDFYVRFTTPSPPSRAES